MKQSAVLLQSYIKADKVDELAAILDKIGNPASGEGEFSFKQINSVHFARWVIAPANEKFKASVIYSANVDGSPEAHLHELVKEVSNGLDAILSCCEDYPENPTNETRLSYLKKNSRRTTTFYVGAPGRSVSQVHEEATFHEDVKDFVAINGKKWLSEREAYKAIKDFARSHEKANDLKKLNPPPKGKGLTMILFLLLLIVLLPLILLAIIVLFLFFEWREKPFGKLISQVPEEHITKMKDQEDVIYQNQLSQVFETKPGLRKLILLFFLWATNFAAKNWFVKGDLMGTPTIHFARWVFIDGGKRFVFFSNFDESYDGYLGDFVDNNGWGLNAIYGAAKGYPRTYFLFGGGSYHLSEFLGWGRITQVKSNAWYSAYPWYGQQQIVNKTELRHNLLVRDSLSDKEISELLKRI